MADAAGAASVTTPLAATRYVRALREGSSVPVIVEASDGATYVVKLRGAAQGPRPLIAELVGGALARAAGLDAPALALVTLDAAIADAEPHQEIRETLHASVGLNLGLAWLPDARAYRVGDAVDPQLAARIVAFDRWIDNADRSARNPNLLWSEGRLWLIDHGAALAWQHGWTGGPARRRARIADHVLHAYGEAAPPALADEVIAAAMRAVPDAWYGDGPGADAYAAVLRSR